MTSVSKNAFFLFAQFFFCKTCPDSEIQTKKKRVVPVVRTATCSSFSFSCAPVASWAKKKKKRYAWGTWILVIFQMYVERKAPVLAKQNLTKADELKDHSRCKHQAL